MEATSESQVDGAAVAVRDGETVTMQNGNGDGAAEGTPSLSLMEQFLNDPSLDYKPLKYGDVMDGIVMRVDPDEILVDIGSKSEGVVPSREFSSLSNEERDALATGETVLVFVVQPENQEGQAVVSIDRARQEKSWRRLQEIFEANDVIEAEVTNYNKGGLLVNLDGVRGFVPASQVSEIRGGDEASKQADMARMIGTSLPLKVIEINRHRNRLILSERQAVQERRDVMKERLIEQLKEGEVRTGRVSSICDFGAFVDIGGADGLVHLSELSWSRVRHPSEILRIGQEVEVFVLGINPQERKIALSLKRTQAEPWSQVGSKYEVGQLVRGTITQLANFGAFARIEDGIEGLIHVSELTDERIVHPKQVVKEGDELILRIIRIDPQRRRMGLSLRRALDTPDTELVAVFGDEILEERDRIVAQLRAALEAEGIEPGSGRQDEESSSAADGAPRAEAATTPSADVQADAAPAATADAPSAEAPATQPAPAPAAAPATQTSSQRSSRREQVAAPTSGEPMSAMEAAFAAAGALIAPVDEDAATGGDTPTGGAAEATQAQGIAAADAPQAETGETSADAAGPTTDAGEDASVVDRIVDTASTVVDTATTVVDTAATVVDTAATVVGKVVGGASSLVERIAGGPSDDEEDGRPAQPNEAAVDATADADGDVTPPVDAESVQDETTDVATGDAEIDALLPDPVMEEQTGS